jgi:lipopolysaccharide transport system ATP-binding protein
MTVAVEAHGLGKLYRLYHSNGDRFLTLLPGFKTRKPADLWALRGIDLHLPPGKCVGIIGRNGAGKSTLLKLLNGVVAPSVGDLAIHGNVLSLLELGTGFNPELSGRENIRKTGTLLGYEQGKIETKMLQITEFADIGEYIDVPIKNYSSGMLLRVAFAFYVNLDPEILIIDEALSVGDFFFQQKCAQYMRAMKERGTTIIFVSHDMTAVQELCDEVILLDKGEVVMRGDANSVTSYYQTLGDAAPRVTPSPVSARGAGRESLNPDFATQLAAIRQDDVLLGSKPVGEGGASLLALRILDKQGASARRFASGDTLIMEAAIKANRTIQNLNFGALIADADARTIWTAATSNQAVWFGALEAGDMVLVKLELQLNIPPGPYDFHFTIGDVDRYDPGFAIWHDSRLRAAQIEVLSSALSACSTGLAYIDFQLNKPQ